MAYKIGTKEKPLVLKTPPLTSEYTMHVDEKDGKEVLVCTVGKTVLLTAIRKFSKKAIFRILLSCYLINYGE